MLIKKTKESYKTKEPYLPAPHVGGARLMTVWLGGGGGQQTAPRGSAVIVGWLSL